MSANPVTAETKPAAKVAPTETSDPSGTLPSTGGTAESSHHLTPLEIVVVGFGLWTVAFWISILLSLGWLPALVIFLLLCAGTWVAFDRPSVSIGERLPQLGDVSTWALLGAFAVPLWLETTDSNLAIVAVVGLCAVMAVTAGPPEPNTPRSLLFLAAAAVAGGIGAWAYINSWSLFIAVVVIAAIAAIALSWTAQGAEPDLASDASWRAELPVLAGGAVLALWAFTSPQPNPDDIYYLNKAANYAQSPLRFYFEDHLYGLDGIKHLSTSDYISSPEPLVGLGSVITGIRASLFRASIFAPAAAFAIPAALRYAARALDARRPAVVALIAAMPLLYFRTTGDSLLLIDKVAQGKGVAALVGIPVLLGAALRYGDHRPVPGDPASRRTAAARLLVIASAAIGLFGLTGSIVVSALGLLGAVFAALAVNVRFRPADLPTRLLIPIGGLFVLGLISFLIEPATGLEGEMKDLFENARASWVRRSVTPFRDAEIFPSVFVALIPACLIGSFFIATTHRTRLVLAAMATITFGIMYNPIFFDAIITEQLNLNWLSSRFGWMLPLGLAIGIAADTLSRRHGWIGSAVVAAGLAAVILTGTPEKIDLRGPTHDLAPIWFGIGEQIIAATPEGGRYLAPDQGELAVSVLSPDIHPTYGRKLYLDDIPKFNDRPDFHYEERLQLMWWIRGDKRGTEDPAMLLDTVEIDTVCLGKGLYETPLGEAVTASYELQFETKRHCDVWARSGN